MLPALVQGENAPRSIVERIKEANEKQLCDVLIVGRGGGSIEELWAFNEEAVARAIFASDIPIISAVGHETDFTISDFTADMRAPTPTGAAELAVPSTADLIERIKSIDIRLTRAVKNRTSQAKDRLVALQSSYAFRFPKRLQEQKEQQFDMVFDRFQKQLTRQMEQKRSQLDRQTYRLKPLHPKEQLLQAKNAMPMKPNSSFGA